MNREFSMALEQEMEGSSNVGKGEVPGSRFTSVKQLRRFSGKGRGKPDKFERKARLAGRAKKQSFNDYDEEDY